MLSAATMLSQPKPPVDVPSSSKAPDCFPLLYLPYEVKRRIVSYLEPHKEGLAFAHSCRALHSGLALRRLNPDRQLGQHMNNGALRNTSNSSSSGKSKGCLKKSNIHFSLGWSTGRIHSHRLVYDWIIRDWQGSNNAVSAELFLVQENVTSNESLDDGDEPSMKDEEFDGGKVVGSSAPGTRCRVITFYPAISSVEPPDGVTKYRLWYRLADANNSSVSGSELLFLNVSLQTWIHDDNGDGNHNFSANYERLAALGVLLQSPAHNDDSFVEQIHEQDHGNMNVRVVQVNAPQPSNHSSSATCRSSANNGLFHAQILLAVARSLRRQLKNGEAVDTDLSVSLRDIPITAPSLAALEELIMADIAERRALMEQEKELHRKRRERQAQQQREAEARQRRGMNGANNNNNGNDNGAGQAAAGVAQAVAQALMMRHNDDETAMMQNVVQGVMATVMGGEDNNNINNNAPPPNDNDPPAAAGAAPELDNAPPEANRQPEGDNPIPDMGANNGEGNGQGGRGVNNIFQNIFAGNLPQVANNGAPPQIHILGGGGGNMDNEAAIAFQAMMNGVFGAGGFPPQQPPPPP